MRQERRKSIPVARRYIRAGSRRHDHAGCGHTCSLALPERIPVTMCGLDRADVCVRSIVAVSACRARRERRSAVTPQAL
jgi:hypothetical protein